MEELEQQLRQHTERVEELRRAQLSLLSQLNPHSAGQDQRIERVRLAAVTGKWATPPKPRRPRRKPKPKPKPKPARASPRKAATPKRRSVVPLVCGVHVLPPSVVWRLPPK